MTNSVARILRDALHATRSAMSNGAKAIERGYRHKAGELREASERFVSGDLRGAAEIRSPKFSHPDNEATGPIPRIPHPSEATPERTGLGSQVEELTTLSPTLSADVREILSDGWTIRYDDIGGGAYSNRQRREIVFDNRMRDGDPGPVVRALAHEVGHARRAAYRPRPVRYEGQSREMWVRESVFEHLRDEGEAALVEAQVAREIAEAGGPRLRVSGRYGAQYEDIYERHMRGELTRDEARQQCARWYADESRSGGGQNYRSYYEEIYNKDFTEMGLDAFERNYRNGSEGPS
ncbi:hypothetical protein ACQP2U_37880 [Nocardia sp. CA-084685]|uniref:hypothetical protein n=1 Tax=Nocardia sp. CA-084685 TaxID=3239970 RepID=UPI003D996B5C